MPRYGGSLAFEAAMNESPYSQYDSGEDGMFEECRSCRFHRPHGIDRTCVFRRCPYSSNKESPFRSHGVRGGGTLADLIDLADGFHGNTVLS